MTFPGTCDAGECLNGIGITAIFEYHVGKNVAESITDFCICNSDTKFGAFCEQDIPAVNETLIDCNANSMTFISYSMLGLKAFTAIIWIRST